jgi:hypothetical protein
LNGSKDVWTYRLVISWIGLAILAVIVVAGQENPQGTMYIGTTATGALAGLLPYLFRNGNGSPSQKGTP